LDLIVTQSGAQLTNVEKSSAASNILLAARANYEMRQSVV